MNVSTENQAAKFLANLLLSVVAVLCVAIKCDNRLMAESSEAVTSQDAAPEEPYKALKTYPSEQKRDDLDGEAARRAASEDRSSAVPKNKNDKGISPSILRKKLSPDQLAVYYELQNKLNWIDQKIKELPTGDKASRLALESEALHVNLRRLEISPRGEWPEQEQKVRNDIERISRSLQ